MQVLYVAGSGGHLVCLDAKTGEFVPADLLELIHPDEQPAFAFAMSVMPLAMAPLMIAFAPEEKQAEMKPVLKEVEALLKKYGFEDEAAKAGEEQEEKKEVSPEERLAELNALMKGKDHIALVRESWAILDKLGAKESSSSDYNPEEFEQARKSLKVEGDRATLKVPWVMLAIYCLQ